MTGLPSLPRLVMTSSPLASGADRFFRHRIDHFDDEFILVDVHGAGLRAAFEAECARFGRAGVIEAASRPRTLRLIFSCWGCSLQARRREW